MENSLAQDRYKLYYCYYNVFKVSPLVLCYINENKLGNIFWTLKNKTKIWKYDSISVTQ